MQRVYATSGISLVSAIAVAQFAVNTGFAWYHPTACVLGGLVSTIGGIVATSRMAP